MFPLDSCQAAITHAAATASTRNDSRRLPNSIAMLIGACESIFAGTKLSGVQRGQVGQPRPEPVTRTAAPVTVMPTLTTIAARAHRRIDSFVGNRTER